MTLYARLGGERVVGRIVDDLSRRLLDDPRLGPWFAELDHDLMLAHRTAYITVLLEGPEEYEGDSMRQAHQPLGLSDLDMDAFMRILQEVLDDQQVDRADAAAVMHSIGRLRPAIVSPSVPGAARRPATDPRDPS